VQSRQPSQRIASYESCLLGSLKPDCWLTPAFLPHSPALAKAVQLAAQAFSRATVTAAGAQARLLTLAGLTSICIAHSIHSKVSAEFTVSRLWTAAVC